MLICQIEGCNNPKHQRGWCSKHYARWYKHGDPLYTTREMHGMTYSPEYISWCSMLTRCYNPNQPGYVNYGERGIAVCDRWRHSFMNFYADMGDKPEGDYSLERINNDVGYSPENCRWATRVEQNLNQRVRKDNTSGVRGVYAHKDSGWVAYYRNKYLGWFRTKEAAIKTRHEAELRAL